FLFDAPLILDLMEGYYLTTKKVIGAAKGIDSKTMVLQYLDTLKALGASPSTKYVFPLEFTNLIAPLRDYAKDSDKK
ncbi:MAG: hypothetical protein JRM95_05845, partial [Nitrososphaerota archaeon]|nr:hypothetical protein [Nitrososphaerota archaeon]